MKKITINDIIFATASNRGKVTNFRFSGLMSMAEIIRAIKRGVGNASGLMTISLRNMTQGWCEQKSLYISPMPVRTSGVQLSLF